MNDNVRLGYACVNMTLTNPPKRSGLDRITTSRTARLATWKSSGIELLGHLALQNACDLYQYLEWNEAHDIRLFRIGSELFPWHDHYELKDLPQYDEIREILQECGRYAREHGHRLTTHPGPYHVLGSLNPKVVEKTIIGLERHSETFDLLGFEPSFENKINIHVGSAADGHHNVSARWIKNYYRLSDRCRARLVLENDDKASLYSLRLLYELFFEKTNIPLTFDYHHHQFCTGDLTPEQACKLAAETWPKDVRQAVHYSESRREELQRTLTEFYANHGMSTDDLDEDSQYSKIYAEYNKVKAQAHSDYIINPIDNFGLDLDVMIEAKAKELALLQYREKFSEKVLLCEAV